MLLAKERTRIELLTDVVDRHGTLYEGTVVSLPNDKAKQFIENGWACISDDSIVALVEHLSDMGVTLLTFKKGCKPDEDLISVLRKAKISYTSKGAPTGYK